jgi:hypothetical protein
LRRYRPLPVILTCDEVSGLSSRLRRALDGARAAVLSIELAPITDAAAMKRALARVVAGERLAVPTMAGLKPRALRGRRTSMRRADSVRRAARGVTLHSTL